MLSIPVLFWDRMCWACGDAVPYPIEYAKTPGEFGLMKVRYFVWEDFWIVPQRPGDGSRVRVVHLYERSRGRPPAAPPAVPGSDG